MKFTPMQPDCPAPEADVVAGRDAIVELKRCDGRTTVLRVPSEHLDRLLALADNDHERAKVIRRA